MRNYRAHRTPKPRDPNVKFVPKFRSRIAPPAVSRKRRRQQLKSAIFRLGGLVGLHARKIKAHPDLTEILEWNDRDPNRGKIRHLIQKILRLKRAV